MSKNARLFAQVDTRLKRRFRMLKLLFFIATMRMSDHQHLTVSLWQHFNNTYRPPRAWQLRRPQHEFDAYFSNITSRTLGIGKRTLECTARHFST